MPSNASAPCAGTTQRQSALTDGGRGAQQGAPCGTSSSARAPASAPRCPAPLSQRGTSARRPPPGARILSLIQHAWGCCPPSDTSAALRCSKHKRQRQRARRGVCHAASGCAHARLLGVLLSRVDLANDTRRPGHMRAHRRVGGLRMRLPRTRRSSGALRVAGRPGRRRGALAPSRTCGCSRGLTGPWSQSREREAHAAAGWVGPAPQAHGAAAQALSQACNVGQSASPAGRPRPGWGSAAPGASASSCGRRPGSVSGRRRTPTLRARTCC